MYVLNKKCFYKSSLSSADHRNAINKTNATHSSWKEDPKFPAAPEKEKKTRQVFNLMQVIKMQFDICCGLYSLSFRKLCQVWEWNGSLRSWKYCYS